MKTNFRLAVIGAAAVLSLFLPIGAAHAAGDPGAISASGPQHFITKSYSIPAANQDFSYTVKVNTALATDNIYYAQYNYAEADDGGYYSGIQPHPDGTVNVRFSFFGAGATPIGSNCDSGADGDSGVTCALDGLAYRVGTKYTITSHRQSDANGVTYTGTITNLSTGVKTTIGAWRLPANYGGFSDQMTAFIERFWGISSCADIPAVSVDYSNITVGGTAVSISPVNKVAGFVPGSNGIYRCNDVSDYQLTSNGAGNYSVRSQISS
ncbi:DUF3472 domain-containing protein [Psychromicrobium lacuslunae]|uniref:DUF3472 domain-containing protein n=1 Tax=Psychromicrobium lacuslunae TaxID=1618207 RepID=UPI000696233F|nr:hypothetical protein [Psychromicrobium lacuslunae]